MPGLYMASLNLKDRDALVIGGGRVALRKVRALAEAGAKITVVSPQFCAGLRKFADTRPAINLRKRSYRSPDVRNKWLAVAATDDPDVNRKVAADSAALKIFCNVADQPDLCTFQIPAVVKRGLLRIAVSTGGASPSVARDIRRKLEKDFPRDVYVPLLNVLLILRRHLRKKYPNDKRRRRRLMKSFLETCAEQLLLKRISPADFHLEVERWKSL